jgi:hypothetical protein
MEILTILNDLYQVNPEDEDSVIYQLKRSHSLIRFREGRKSIILTAKNIVSIEYYERAK